MRHKKKKIFTESDNKIVVIESVGFEGVSIARLDNMVYFVKGGVPGDKVLIRLLRKKRNYIEADILEIIESSEHRVNPPCKYFGICGGCTWQQFSYGEQIKWKRQHIIDCFQRIGKIEIGEVLHTLPSPEIYHYRNKMEYSFSDMRWFTKEEIALQSTIEYKGFALGLHIPGVYQKVLDINECHLIEYQGIKVLNRIREQSIAFGLDGYNILKREGFLRNLIIRNSNYNKDLMIILITKTPKSKEEKEFTEWYCNQLRNEFGLITSLIHSINENPSPVAVGEISFVNGNNNIVETINDVSFQISPFSFFQTNSFQLNRFINAILNFAEIKSNDIVWDLYCGTGSISLPAARKAGKLYGFELVESSIEDARKNASLNNINNVLFNSLDLHSKDISLQLSNIEIPDIILVDPPRAGMHKILVNTILNCNPKRIVYVSCNPATQARDCELLSESYKITKIQPVDMFPHTYHIESIALLDRL